MKKPDKQVVEDKVRSLIRKPVSVTPKLPLNQLRLEVASYRKNVLDEILRTSGNIIHSFIVTDYISVLDNLAFLDMVINTDISKHASRVQDYLKLLKNNVVDKLKERSS